MPIQTFLMISVGQTYIALTQGYTARLVLHSEPVLTVAPDSHPDEIVMIDLSRESAAKILRAWRKLDRAA